jgi:hypothetical protein
MKSEAVSKLAVGDLSEWDNGVPGACQVNLQREAARAD